MVECEKQGKGMCEITVENVILQDKMLQNKN